MKNFNLFELDGKSILVPERIGHDYVPIDILHMSVLQFEYAINHRRLQVFHFKGLKCANPHCNKVGAYMILAARNDKKGNDHMHLDLYTKDFELMTVDHIKPKSKGGGNGLDNLQPMCNSCNREKSNTYFE